jgi:hypothetical protein
MTATTTTRKIATIDLTGTPMIWITDADEYGNPTGPADMITLDRGAEEGDAITAICKAGWTILSRRTDRFDSAGRLVLDVARTDRVDTSQLAEGDLVLNHDMRIRLTDRQEHDHGNGPLWSFTGIVENADELRADRDHVTTGLLRADGLWTVQGNTLAKWTRILEG